MLNKATNELKLNNSSNGCCVSENSHAATKWDAFFYAVNARKPYYLIVYVEFINESTVNKHPKRRLKHLVRSKREVIKLETVNLEF